MPIACWDCRNLIDFVQVSARADARDVVQTSSGMKPTPWDRSDARTPGLYCRSCAQPVDADLDALDLVDDRIDFVQPDAFDAELLALELEALRPDATWTRLELPEQPPVHADTPAGVHPALLSALERTRRLPLFSHQASAIEAALRGEHVVQATSAGSGKSLGFVVPVLDALLRDPSATAVMAFPLKALANDQLAGLERLGVVDDPWIDSSSFDLVLDDGADPIRVARYDGSTADHERVNARRNARLLITTPDMLHTSVLRMGMKTYKDGSSWGPLFRGLRFVVLDELHAYQGVFGSNVAHVLRRLRRTAKHYRSAPQFLAASATIGNPVDLAAKITGTGPFTLVDDDGSPRRRRLVLICNPPERAHDAATTKAQATKKGDDAAADLDGGRIAPQTVAIDLVARGALSSDAHLPVRTISFARSRNAVFQLAQRIRNTLKEERRPELAASVASYAATFLADDRIEAEGRLRDGSTLAIVSTNALELGIDIPDLSLAVLVGYPGQISSFRQRVGRVGRSGQGLAVLIVGDDPLQQYLARDAAALRELLAAPAETVVVNPDAPEIARRYGLAPALEEFGGVAFEDAEFFGPIVDDWLAEVTGAPTCEVAGTPYWHVPCGDEPYVGIRNAVANSSYTVLLQDRRDRRAIGVIDSASAPRDAFVPAIWTNSEGDLFRVVGVDPKLGEIYCEGPVEVGYLTRGISVDRVEIVTDHFVPREAIGGTVGFALLDINRQVYSYKEQHFSGVEHTRQIERGWPAVEFRTDGLYVELGPDWTSVPQAEESIRAVEHLLLSVAPALVACDPYDLDATSDKTRIYLYDSFGGGIRLAEPVFTRFDELVRLAYEVVTTCACESGCPSCVMLSRRPDGNRGLSKPGAIAILSSLLAGARTSGP
jgi:DEAD/DEAH box helicase domain-containing protein